MPLVEITAVGAMVKPEGDDRYRPKARGDRVNVDEDTARALVSQGAAAIVDGRVAEHAEDEQPDAGAIDLNEGGSTIAELRKFANARRPVIDVGSLRTRPEIVAAIEDSLTSPDDEDGD